MSLDARLVVTRPGFRLDVELAIDPGQTVALLGPNGAGKTTAVLALAGLVPLHDGRIDLGGRTLDDPAADVFVPPEERRVAVVFQDHLLFPHLTVAENVAFGLRSRGTGRGEADARAEHWLERVGLAGAGRRSPTSLSGGEAQRVALARALVTEPDLLLLDEPLASLDVSTRVVLRRLLAEHLEGFAGPRLLITHDPDEAFLLAHEIRVIEGGVITQMGTADDVRLAPRTGYVADLAGSNLLSGVADHGVVLVGSQPLTVVGAPPEGRVLLTIRPSAVSVHRLRPEGSQRNTWQTVVERVERHGDRARLLVGEPLPLTVEITSEAVGALGLREGSRPWIAVKATEIGVDY